MAGALLVAGPFSPLASQAPPDSAYGQLLEPLRLLNVTGAHQLGLTGEGVRVGVLAPAFQLDHEAFRELRVVGSRDLVEGDDDVSPGPDDPPEGVALGTAVLSLVAGRLDGRLLAPAYQADLLLARVGGGGQPVREDEERWVEGLAWLVEQGAQVVVSAVGFRDFQDFSYEEGELDGDTPLSTAAADDAAALGVLVVAPSGNDGPESGSLRAPADGDSVLAVGASDLDGRARSFSARGPTADGRPRPQVLAPGGGMPAAHPSAPDSLVTVSGTEHAAALVSGAAALFLQAHASGGPLRVLDGLVSAGHGRVTPSPVPDRPPVPDVASAILFPDGFSPVPLDEVSPGGRATSLTPLFRWDVPTVLTDAFPLRYVVQVAGDSLFAPALLSDTVEGALEHRFARPLPPRLQAFWRVEAITSVGVRRRTAVRGPVAVPSWVELRVLNDPAGVTVPEARPTFRWDGFPVDPPAGPLVFDLEITSGRENGDPVLRVTDLEVESFTPDTDLPFNEPLRWSIVARSPGGGADTATSAGPFVVTSRSRPPVTILYQNFPNPFPGPGDPRPETRIWFDLADAGPVQLAVYDLRGRLVRRLIPRSGCGAGSHVMEAGQHGREAGAGEGPCVLLHWDGRDESGERVAPGVYLLRLRAGGTEDIRRMVFWP